MTNWRKIHWNFYRVNTVNGRTYQQEWEAAGLTYQDAKEWVQEVDIFGPWDYNEVRQWKEYGFTAQQTKEWINIGLDKYKKNSVEFAAYLKWKRIEPNSELNLKTLRGGFDTWLENNKPAQDYLDWKYPQDQRKNIIELHLFNQKLTGILDLKDFCNLEKLFCSDNKLTDLKLDNCLKLKMLGCSNNDFSGQDLSFLLKNSALEYLNIGYTNFSSGLEYVPDGVERFYCSYFDHEDKKIKFINQELMKYVKDGEQRSRDCNFADLLKLWKKDNPDKVNPVIIERLTYQNQILESENSQLKNELQMEREEVEKALQKAQEWRERQLKEITEQKDAEIERLKEENANLKQLLDQQAQIEVVMHNK